MDINTKIQRLKNKKTALFFDLDGTLLSKDGTISPEDGAAITKLVENGHYVFINTGRAKAYLPHGLTDALPFSGIICGASYVECNGKILKNHYLSKKARKEVLSFCRKNNIPVIFEGVHTNYSYEFDNSAIKITYDQELSKKEGYILAEDYCNGDDIQTTKVTFLKVLSDIDVSDITLLRVIKFKTYAESLLLGNNKANAMDVVLDYLGIPRDCTISFGDSENDVEMLKATAISVAMPHAAESAKQCADVVSNISDAIKMIFG